MIGNRHTRRHPQIESLGTGPQMWSWWVIVGSVLSTIHYPARYCGFLWIKATPIVPVLAAHRESTAQRDQLGNYYRHLAPSSVVQVLVQQYYLFLPTTIIAIMRQHNNAHPLLWKPTCLCWESRQALAPLQRVAAGVMVQWCTVITLETTQRNSAPSTSSKLSYYGGSTLESAQRICDS